MWSEALREARARRQKEWKQELEVEGKWKLCTYEAGEKERKKERVDGSAMARNERLEIETKGNGYKKKEDPDAGEEGEERQKGRKQKEAAKKKKEILILSTRGRREWETIKPKGPCSIKTPGGNEGRRRVTKRRKRRHGGTEKRGRGKRSQAGHLK